MSDEPRTEQDEVEDPGKRGGAHTEDAEVEGHRRWSARTETDDDDEPEVEGHRRARH